MRIKGKLPLILAGAFGIWCILVWTIGNEWKELFVYYPLFPSSILIKYLTDRLESLIIPNPDVATGRDWLLLDRIDGIAYLLAGWLWYFMIGVVMSKIIRRLKSRHQPNGMGPALSIDKSDGVPRKRVEP